MKLKIDPYLTAIQIWQEKLSRRNDSLKTKQMSRLAERESLQKLLYEINSMRRNIDWLEQHIIDYLKTTTLEDYNNVHNLWKT